MQLLITIKLILLMNPSARILQSSFLLYGTLLNFLLSMPEWSIYLQQDPGLDWARELLPPDT